MTLHDFHQTIMDRPEQYAIFRNKKYFLSTDYPLSYSCNNGNFGMYDIYIDTRYSAKMRLYNYLKKNAGVTDGKYEPFKGTQIGISEPILNF